MSKARVELSATNIHDASTADIVAFASSAAGLEFSKGASRDYMLREIFDALMWAQKSPDEGATHVKLKIGYSPEEGGQRDVRVGHRGKMLSIRREEELTIPIGHYNVLMEVNNLGYIVPPLGKDGKLLSNEVAVSQRITKTLYPIMVLEFIDNGEAEPDAPQEDGK